MDNFLSFGGVAFISAIFKALQMPQFSGTHRRQRVAWPRNWYRSSDIFWNLYNANLPASYTLSPSHLFYEFFRPWFDWTFPTVLCVTTYRQIVLKVILGHVTILTRSINAIFWVIPGKQKDESVFIIFIAYGYSTRVIWGDRPTKPWYGFNEFIRQFQVGQTNVKQYVGSPNNSYSIGAYHLHS